MCISCVIDADTCTESLCVSELTDLFSLFSHLFHMPAVPSQSLPHLPYGTCQIKLVIVVCDLPASSAGLGLVLEEAKVGSCDCAGATISCVIKSWIFLKTCLWCWCFRTPLGGRLDVGLSCQIPAVFYSMFSPFLQIWRGLCRLFCCCLVPLPFFWLLFLFWYSLAPEAPCICFHLTAGLCSIIPFNGAWWCLVLYSETGIRLHPALFCC